MCSRVFMRHFVSIDYFKQRCSIISYKTQDEMEKPMTNRFNEKEKLFEKKTVTLENTEKTFEYAVKGSEGTTVVLINGSGGPIEGWMKVWPRFDHTITVFAYNRLGIDKSSEPNEPQNANIMVDDLRTLLKTLDLKPPFLLVGHSLGGFIAHVFAALYPQEIMGVIFLETSTVEDVPLRPQKIKGNPYNEVNCVIDTVAQIRALPPFPQIPITVIAGFHPVSRKFLPKGKLFKRFEHQKKLLELSSQSSFIVAAKSGHFPQMNESKLVVESIYDRVGR